MKPGQLKSADEAIHTPRQHSKPCADCPWAREALPGWLGGMSVDQWLQAAHGEGIIECHTLLPHQCAGSAIYRKNVLKNPRDKAVLVLPADREHIFKTPAEFRAHHEQRSNGG
jgi:hypothetical protein